MPAEKRATAWVAPKIEGAGIDTLPRAYHLENMRFIAYASVVFWVTLTLVSTVDIGATARLLAKLHLG